MYRTFETQKQPKGTFMNYDGVTEKFGIYFSEVGLSKTYGRLFGFFMTTTQPTSMGKLVEKLQIYSSQFK
jgi:DNA-binding transcriptional regulator GbsR (MarR family)